MSTRGLNFFNRWMSAHLPNATTDDPAAVADLAGEMMKAAEREGIPANEINEEVSVFELVFEAMQHREGSSTQGDQTVRALLAGRLAREAQITEEQARELINLVGTDWSSLLREAHFLKERDL